MRRLIPGPSPLGTYFADLDRRVRRLAPVDSRAFVRGRIFDGCGTMPKGRLAARSRGARTVYPYCDRELIDYWFHLPLAASQPDEADHRHVRLFSCMPDFR